MSEIEQFDVVIVGAGLVGASIAVALAQHSSLKLAVVDAGNLVPKSLQGQSGFEPRVSALTLASQAWLQRLQTWQQLGPEDYCDYRAMSVWEEDGTGAVSFHANDVAAPSLGCIVENIRVQQVLAEQLQQLPIQILSHAKVIKLDAPNNGRRTLTLDDGYQLSGELIVAADGAQSTVRQLAGMDTRAWDYGHQAIVTTVETALPHQQTAWQKFTNTGPIAFLPLNSPHQPEQFCSLVWSVERNKAKQLMALDDPAFTHQLERAFESRLGAIKAVDQRYSFELQQSHAKKYWQDNLVLVGDAAHRIHPLAGQGANLGFLDAAALTETVLAAQGRPLGQPYDLRKYQRSREAHNLSMTMGMEVFKRLFEADHPAARLIRNYGMKWFDANTLVKSQVAKLAMGISGPVPDMAKPQ